MIGQSERINVPLETKKEVVLTLLEYPLVVKELNIKDQLLGKCNEIRTIQELEIDSRDKQINNLNLQIDNLERQKKLFKKQLKHKSNQLLGIGGVGILIGVAVILL